MIPPLLKKDDKRSTVVLWDRENYLREANSKLSDNMYVKKQKVTRKVLS